MLSVRNRLFPLVVLPLFLTLFQGVAAAQQCTNCTPVSIPDTPVSGDSTSGGGRDTYDVNSTPSVYTGSSGQSEQPGYINVVITQAGTTPLPANLPAGTYPAWCGTSPTDGNGAQDYIATTMSNPYSATQWNEINYILNNKQGYVIDVQVAIWGVLGAIAESDMVAAGYTTAAALYNTAVANGQTFIPAPGQHTAVILLSQHRTGATVWQHLIVEMVNCGSIGEVFWNDSTNNNGILPLTTVNGTTTAGEPGINGVTVNLLDANNNVIETTVTAPSPIQYPYLPPDTNGWYQFTGLCAGSYSVSFDTSQSALTGLLLETPVTNQAYPVIYTNPNPVAVTLSASYNPAVNEANNFAFSGYAPLNVNCAATGGTLNSAYSSQMVVTGGTSPYTYTLASGSLPPGLSLNGTTGTITGLPTTTGTYTFSIQVKDSSGLSAGTTTTSCTITIAPPPVNLQCGNGSAVVGQAYSSSLQAAGGSGGYTFSIVSGSLPAGLTLNTSTGAITGTPTAAGTFSFTAKVVDSAGDSGTSGTVSCSITVVPAPTTTCATITAVQGVAITAATLTGSGGAGAPYTFTATGLPAGLTLNASTGVISGTPTASGTYSYTVTVKDSAGATGTVNCSVTVAPPVTVTCAAITAVQWTAITPVTLTATGGTGTGYTFTASGLPAGVTISSTGAISGTPVVSGTFAYTVTVTDGSGNTGTANCSVTVALPITATCATIVAVQGLPIQQVTLSPTGGAGGPYTFVAVGLPAGLTMSSSGTISGTPTVSGPFSYTVTIKDVAGNTGTVNCYVNLALPVSATCASITAIQGVAITPVTMTATGGSGTGYTFTATGLPAGLTMSSGGTISGTSTVNGTFAYTVTVKDSNGAAGTVNCSVTIAPPVSATCVAITAVQGVAITPVTMTATGGTGTGYSFSATGLPAGVTISSTGTTSGTPTVSGTFNYAVTVTDGGGHTGTVNCSVTVSAPVSATCASITALQGAAITPVTMVATGGTGTGYSFSATGLPSGVTISSTGTISGTPTVSGTFSYTVTVTDGGGHTGTANCSVTVSAPVSATCVSITALQGVAITPVTMVGSGGTGTGYSFSATGLPAGVTISSTGTISGTPTASGTFNYTVTVTDGGGHTGTVNCSVTVVPPVSATCVTITAVQGVAITPVTMVGSGGSGGPYTFAATGLPAGLTMSASGTISGTPTVSGGFSYAVTVTDGGGHTGTSNCSVTVLQAVQVTCAVITATQGTAITPTQVVATGGTGTGYTFSATGLPAGVTISSSGLISGTPTVSGTFSYTVTVTDSAGHTGTANCSMAPRQNPVSANCVTITAIQGVAITPVTMTAAGGSGTGYTFSATGLPSGLSMSTGGTISGTPTVNGTFSYTVTVKDSAGDTGTVNCSVTVTAVTPITPSCAAGTASVGVAYSSAVTATGGTAPYTFSLASGSLPNGLTLNTSTGAITGTPTAAGTSSYTVKVTDSKGATGTTSNCGITVGAPPTLTIVCPTATGTTGVAYSSGATAVGGVAPYTFSIVAGSLPPGLTLNASTGAIIGTPTTAGNYSFSIKVADAFGDSAVSSCSQAYSTGQWSFNSQTGSLGNSWGYSFNGIPVTAYGYSSNGSGAGLCGQNNGGASYGLGIQGTSGNYIDTNHWVTLDISQAIAAGVTGGQITIGGLTPGEGYSLWGSNTLGQLGTQLYSGTSNDNGNPVNIPNCGQYKYISVKPTSGNCLVNGVSFTTTACQITIAPPPISLACAAGTATKGVAYSSGVTVTGGTGPYTFSIASGSLPAGLTLNTSTGAITGTPTVSGSFGYTVKVTDSKGNTATTSNCGMTVAAPPALTILCPTTTGTAGTAYSSGATAAGGVPPYTFSIATGSLPPGLTLNASTGAITGTPTAAGTYSFSIKVTDVTGGSTVSSCSQAYNTGQWSFASRVGNLGNSYGFSFNGVPVTSYGYSSNGSGTALCGHNDSYSTYGLGIQGTYGNYLDTNHWVTLDISQAISAGATSGQITITGLTGGEGYAIYGSNTLGQLGTQLYTGTSSTNGQAVNIPNCGQYKYISVKATWGNCLVSSISFAITACQITIAAAPSNPVTTGDCGTVGFWQNSDGQNLIQGVNGGNYSHNLANWLAQQFPYLYGPHSSNDLTNHTNQDVANLFLTYFAETSSKTDAQLLGAALSCYFTNSGLGGNQATQYGFNSSSSGTASKYYNVATNGSSIGLQNNQSYTVMQLLQQCNNTRQNGTYNATVCGSIFSNINNTGHVY